MSNLSVGVNTKIVSSGRKPIESVGASTAAFIGHSVKGPTDKAVLITSWANYLKHFSSFSEAKHLAHAVYGFFQNGGSRCYVLSIGSAEDCKNEKEAAAKIQGVDKGPGHRTGINLFNNIEDISMVAVPGMTSKEVQTIVKDHCERVAGRIAILDGIENLGEMGLNEIPKPQPSEESAVYFPWLEVFDPERGEKRQCLCTTFWPCLRHDCSSGFCSWRTQTSG